jgi:hypothetical protein
MPNLRDLPHEQKQEVQQAAAEIRQGAAMLLITWASQGYDPDAPMFRESDCAGPILAYFRAPLATLTDEPVENISGRRGLEFMLLLAAYELNLPLPQTVRERLHRSVFGKEIADALKLGASVIAQGNKLVLTYPKGETTH